MYSLGKRNLRKKEPEASVTSGGFINAKILHCEDLKNNLRNKKCEDTSLRRFEEQSSQ